MFGGECVSDREWNLQADEVFCQAIPDGTLAKVRRGSTWVLFLEWSEGYGRRLLTHGSREHVERYALDVAAHGPPGGPEFRGEERVWRGGDDGTLHAPTVNGEFRLMPLVGGQHLLVFARNDVGVFVLGIGESAELQRTADDRLQGFRGGAITLDVGPERIPLRGITAAGVLGYVDSFDGARLLLGHLGGEQFGLFYVRGQTGECMDLYDLAALRRGDLGRVVCWQRHDPRGVKGDVEVLAERPVGKESAGTPKQPVAEVRPGARARIVPDPEEATVRPVGLRSLSSAELLLLDRHLTPDGPVKGLGATIVPKLLEGLRTLARLGLPNQLLRTCEVHTLFATSARIEIQGCSKTFSRALAAVAAHTRIVRRSGKRWLICLGDLVLDDSELMRWIAEVAPPVEVSMEASSASDVGGGPPEPAVAATDREDLHGLKAASPEGELEAGGPPRDSDRESADDGVDPVGQSLSAYQQYRLRLRRDGPLRVTMASVPIEESASRGEWKKKARDPP
jgi:hypothetical protein